VRCMTCVSNSGRGNGLFSKMSSLVVGSTQPSTQWVLVFFPGSKAAGCEFDHSPLPNAEVKTEWSYTSTPPVCLHHTDRDNVTFLTCI
jgi:hypothetical protein